MSSATDTDTLGEILRLIELTLKVPADKVDIDANFETFGINSLIVMELMESIEKELEVTLTPTQFSNVDSVRGLAELVEGLRQPQATSPKPAAAPAIAPRASTPSAPRGEVEAALEQIARKYSIDLYGRGFDSVDAVVDTLLAEHTGSLIQHYGLAAGSSREPAGRPASTEPPLIAIVGISCRMPDAPDHQSFWDNLIAGRNSIREIPESRWSWQDHYAETVAPGKTVSKWGALLDQVDCFDAAFFGIPAEEAASMDPQLRLLLEETYRAVEDAGIDMRSLAGSRTGVFIGYEYSEYEHHLRQLNNQDFTKGPLFSSSSPAYYLSNRISYVFDLCGPSESINVNCASSAVALNRAFQSLQNGESDLAITGAVSLNLFAGDYIASSQYGVLSADGSSGVFDDDANGFTRGEAVATVVLKRLTDAERDKDRIYALVRSSHQTYRGTARNISEVKYESIARVLSECYEKAGVPIESVRYIEVDGYASKWADSFEYEGIKSAFSAVEAEGKRCALGSLKGNIGNVESVSGLANVLKLALSLHHKRFPATISMKKLNSFIDVDSPTNPLYIADRELDLEALRDASGQAIRAGINSFADSGSNVHILLEEYMGGVREQATAVVGKQLFVLSAKTPVQLAESVRRYVDLLERHEARIEFADLVFTSQIGRESHGERLAIAAANGNELLEKLRQVAKAGIRERLGMEGREIFHARVESNARNGLAGLITPEMALTQLQQCQQTGSWKQVALLWVHGVGVPWGALWKGQAVRRLSAPTYPFEKQRHWIEVELAGAQSYAIQAKTMAEPEPPAAVVVAEAPKGGVEARSWHFYYPRHLDTAPASALDLDAAAKLELFMRQEIAAQLEVSADEVQIDINFIELGLNSISVADLIIKLDALLGINLSPSVLFKHPDVASLSEFLASQHAERAGALVVSTEAPSAEDVAEPQVAAAAAAGADAGPPVPLDILIPLQTKGSKPPIFALPGAGGSALSLQQLSHALGADQPFYCLESIGLHGDWPAQASVEEVAAFNLEAVRAIQTGGPYRLLGYSNGGVVAFEMARQLQQKHAQRASLILLDSPAPGIPGKDPEQEMAEVFAHFVDSLGATSTVSADELKGLSPIERAEFLHACTERLGLKVPKQQFLATFAAAQASEQACQAYVAEALREELEVTLFRARQGYPDAPVDYGWNRLLLNPVRVLELAGDHFSVLDAPASARIAQELQAPAATQDKPQRRTRGRKRA